MEPLAIAVLVIGLVLLATLVLAILNRTNPAGADDVQINIGEGNEGDILVADAAGTQITRSAGSIVEGQLRITGDEAGLLLTENLTLPTPKTEEAKQATNAKLLDNTDHITEGRLATTGVKELYNLSGTGFIVLDNTLNFARVVLEDQGRVDILGPNAELAIAIRNTVPEVEAGAVLLWVDNESVAVEMPDGSLGRIPLRDFSIPIVNNRVVAYNANGLLIPTNLVVDSSGDISFFNLIVPGFLEVGGNINTIDGNLFTGTQWAQLSTTDQTVSTTSTPTFNGLDAGAALITRVASPLIGTDGVNKDYVDFAVTQISGSFASDAISVTDLTVQGTWGTVIYNPAGAGTLTGGNTAALVIDSFALSIGEVLLVNGQTDPLQNGPYTVTDAGGASNFVLTRLAGWQTGDPRDSAQIAFIDHGAVFVGSTWRLIIVAPAVLIVGTDDITFEEASAGRSPGVGLNAVGNTLNVEGAPITLGAIWTHNGTLQDNILVGTDLQILVVDSAELTGLKWVTPSQEGVVQTLTFASPSQLWDGSLGLNANLVLLGDTTLDLVSNISLGEVVHLVICTSGGIDRVLSFNPSYKGNNGQPVSPLTITNNECRAVLFMFDGVNFNQIGGAENVIQTLVFASPNQDWNNKLGSTAILDLSGDTTLNAITNVIAGNTVKLSVCALASTRTLFFNPEYKGSDGVIIEPLVITAGQCRGLEFLFDGTNFNQIGGSGAVTRIQTLTFTSPNQFWDASLGFIANLSMTADTSLNPATGVIAGSVIILSVSAVGADRTLTFFSDYKSASGLDFGNTIIPVGECRAFEFVYNGTTFNQVGGGEPISSTIQNLIFAAPNQAWDGSLGHQANLILTNSTSLDPCANLVAGDVIHLSACAPGGPFTLSFDPLYLGESGVSLSGVVISGGDCRAFEFVFDGVSFNRIGGILPVDQIQTLTFVSPNQDWDVNLGHMANLSMTGDTIMNSATNVIAGDVIQLSICAVTITRVLTFASTYKTPAGLNVGAFVIPAAECRALSFMFDGTNFNQIGIVQTESPRITIQTLSFTSPNQLWDAALGAWATLFMTGDTTLSVATNVVNGEVLHLSACASGSDRTLSFSGNYKGPEGANLPPLIIPNTECRALEFMFDGTNFNQIGGLPAHSKIQTLTFATPNQSWNATQGMLTNLTLTGDTILDVATGVVTGDSLHLSVCASGAPRTLTFNNVYHAPDGTPIAAFVVPTGECRAFSFMFDGTNFNQIGTIQSTPISDQVQTLAFATPNQLWDASLGHVATLILTANTLLNLATNVVIGDVLHLSCCSSGGAFILTFATDYNGPDGFDVGPITIPNGECRSFEFMFDGVAFGQVGGIPQVDRVQTLTFASPNQSWDAGLGFAANLTMTSDTILNLATNVVAGEIIYLSVCASGSIRTLTFATNYKTPDGIDIGAFVIPNGECRAFGLVFDGANFNQIGNVQSVPPGQTIQTLSFASPNQSWDAALGAFATLVMTGNTSLDPVTNVVVGQSIHLSACASGADRTLTFNAVFLQEDGFLVGPVLIPSGECRAFEFVYDGVNFGQIGGERSDLKIQTLTFAAPNQSWDAGLGMNANLTLTGDTILDSATNVVAGDVVRISLCASGAPRTLTFSSTYKAPDGLDVGAFVVPSGECRALGFMFDGANFNQFGIVQAIPPALNIQTLSFNAPNQSWDGALGLSATLLMTGNTILNTVTNITLGESIHLSVCASAADRILTFNSTYEGIDGFLVGAVVIPSGECRAFEFMFDGTNFGQIGGFTASERVQTLTFAAPNQSWDAALGMLTNLTLTGATILNAATNVVAGDVLHISCCASGGNQTITFASDYKSPDGTDVGAVLIPSTECRAFAFMYNGTNFNQIGTISLTPAIITIQTLSFASPNQSWDTSLGSLATLLMTGDTILDPASNVTAGQVMTISVCADATPRVLTFNSLYKREDGFDTGLILIPATECRSFEFQFDGTSYRQIGGQNGVTLIQTLTFASPNQSWDAALGQSANLTMTGDTIMDPVTNVVIGDIIRISVCASASVRTLTYNTVYKAPNGLDVGAVVIPSGECRAFAFMYDGTNFNQFGTLQASPPAQVTQTLVFASPTQTWDAAFGFTALLNMTGDTTLSPVTTVVAGDTLHLSVCAIGANRTLTFNSAYLRKDNFDLGIILILSGECRAFEFLYDGTNFLEVGGFSARTLTQTLTFAAPNTAWDIATGMNGVLTLTASTILNPASNVTIGDVLHITVCSDASPWVLTFDAVYKNPDGNAIGAVNFAALACRSYSFMYDGANFNQIGNVSAAPPAVQIQTLTFASPTQTWDAALGQVATLLMTGNTGLAAVTNVVTGNIVVLSVCAQTLDRTLTFATVYKREDGFDLGNIVITAGLCLSFEFQFDGTNFLRIGGPTAAIIIQDLSFNAPNQTWNGRFGFNANLTLTANTIMDPVTDVTAGDVIHLSLCSSGGAFTLTFNTVFKQPDGTDIGGFTVPDTECRALSFMYDGTSFNQIGTIQTTPSAIITQTLVFASPNQSWDAALGGRAILTMTGDTILNAVSNVAAGDVVFLTACASGANRILTFAGTYLREDGFPLLAVTIISSECRAFAFTFTGTEFVEIGGDISSTITQTLVFASPFTLWDASRGHNATLSMTGDTSLAFANNVIAGDVINLSACASGAPRTLGFLGSVYFAPDGTAMGSFLIPTGECRVFSFMFDGSDYIQIGIIEITPAAVIVQTLVFASPNQSWDGSLGHLANLTMTGDTSLNLVSNLVAGEVVSLSVCASGAARTLSFASTYKDSTGFALDPYTIPDTECRSFEFMFDGTNLSERVIRAAQDLEISGGVLFRDSTNTNAVTMSAPGTLSTSLDITLPPNNGSSGQVVTTDGAGVWTYTTPAGAGGQALATPAAFTNNTIGFAYIRNGNIFTAGNGGVGTIVVSPFGYCTGQPTTMTIAASLIALPAMKGVLTSSATIFPSFVKVTSCNPGMIAIDADGFVWSMGSGVGGSLGSGATLFSENRDHFDRVLTAPVTPMPFCTDISIMKGQKTNNQSGAVFFAWENTGGVPNIWGWGQNGTGQLGVADLLQKDFATPLTPPQSVDLVKVTTCSYSATAGASFMLFTNNNLYGTGDNAPAWFNTGTTVDSTVFIQILTNVADFAINAGDNASGSILALTTTNTLQVIGENSDGQLGLGNNTDQSTFQAVPIVSDAAAVFGGTQGVAGSFGYVNLSGTVFFAGNSRVGQLGFGNTADVLTFATPSQLTALGVVVTDVMFVTEDPITIVIGKIGGVGNGRAFAAGDGTPGSMGRGQVGTTTYTTDQQTFGLVTIPPKFDITSAQNAQNVLASGNNTIFYTSQGIMFSCGQGGAQTAPTGVGGRGYATTSVANPVPISDVMSYGTL